MVNLIFVISLSTLFLSISIAILVFAYHYYVDAKYEDKVIRKFKEPEELQVKTIQVFNSQKSLSK